MFEVFRLAFAELYANKGRTVLTALGIAIGVMSICIIISSGGLANQYITGQLTQLAGNTKAIQVNPFQPGSREAVTIVTEQDFKFVKDQEAILPFNSTVPVLTIGLPIQNYENKTVSQAITGTSDLYYPSVKNTLDGLDGRFFSESEYEAKQNVVVVSRDFVKNRLKKATILNESINLGKEKFLVIGEYDEAGVFGTGTELVIMPIGKLWDISGNTGKTLSSIRLIANNESDVAFVKNTLEKNINIFREKQFSGIQSKNAGFTTSQQTVDSVGSILTSFQIFLALVAVISLIVGGIGVLNVMLMSVAQRIKEIGVRKAFGAKNRDILYLFLSESITLTALSGLFGALLAQYLLLLGIKTITYLNPDVILVFEYSWQSVYIALLLSVVVGTIFGIYPAYKAGKMSVVEALRYD